MRLIVQLIASHWSRESRGEPGASLRNAVPEFLALPNDALESEESWHHEVAFDETRGFTPAPARLKALPADFSSTVGLELTRDADSLHCSFVWSAGVGAPTREPRIAFVLRPQQTGRLRFNGRLSLDAHTDRGWNYQKFVYNIAWVDGCAANLFEQVDHEYSSMEFLR